MSETQEKDASLEERKKDHAEGVGELTFKPEEEAAAKFTYLLPYVKKSGSTLSAKAMARVLYRLAEFPLGDSIDIDKMGFRDPAEKQLFKLMYEVNAAKSVIMDHVKKLQTEENSEKKEETNGNKQEAI